MTTAICTLHASLSLQLHFSDTSDEMCPSQNIETVSLSIHAAWPTECLQHFLNLTQPSVHLYTWIVFFPTTITFCNSSQISTMHSVDFIYYQRKILQMPQTLSLSPWLHPLPLVVHDSTSDFHFNPINSHFDSAASFQIQKEAEPYFVQLNSTALKSVILL